MTQSKHILEIYEPYEYKGPNPMVAAGISTVVGPTGSVYYLLELPNPLCLDSDDTTQILVLPRYNGDSIERATNSSCTVNICCVLPGNHFSSDEHFDFDQIHHWGVGKIAPAP